ncbi:hypothetical protein Pcinc_040097 [Petrolisthes cinctipes]|uniref:Uncharacterized protein n=1 Tax=Petrolisthes cinctipes TaxID=88211 RepID=A0AAE1BM86_PETCI|nr:hypothetical protein Pcinc_040097 [Petrolisthes cinctipes]
MWNKHTTTDTTHLPRGTWFSVILRASYVTLLRVTSLPEVELNTVTRNPPTSSRVVTYHDTSRCTRSDGFSPTSRNLKSGFTYTGK